MFEITQPRDKNYRTFELISDIHDVSPGEKILIFAATKRSVDLIVNGLKRNGIRTGGIHGDKSQRDRDQTLHMFRDGTVPVLVATDVASRGLDVNDIKLVINYDMPQNIEDYIHRYVHTK